MPPTDIYIYIYVYTSVDLNAYTCVHTKRTESKEANQKMKAGQHVWFPICHHFGHQFVTISIKYRWACIRSSAGCEACPATLRRCQHGIHVWSGGNVSLGVEATSTGLRFDSMSTGAIHCQQEQHFVDRSHVVSTEAILEDVPAVVCRQEQCRQEQEQCRQE